MWRIWLATALTLIVALTAVVGSAALLNVNSGGLQVFTYPVDIEIPPPPECDASLEFEPDDDIQLQGPSPLQGSIILGNSGAQGSAQNVEITLTLDEDDGTYLSRVVFADSDIWDVATEGDTHVHLVGNIPAGDAVIIDFTVEMTDDWATAPDDTETKIHWVVTREECRPEHNADGHVQAHVTLVRGTSD